MTNPKIEVMNFIEDKFNMEAIRLEELPEFPCGVRIIDAEGGHMVVYWNLLYGRVDYVFRDKEVRG